MSRVALLGSTGMIGSGIAQTLADNGMEVTEFNRQGISVTKTNLSHKFTAAFDSEFEFLSDFDFVINAIGLIRHKINEKSASDLIETIAVNSYFPRELDKFASKHQLKVIQIGTDCIYSGSAGNYSETSKPDPLDIYGYSKVLGEAALTNTNILRVSVVGNEISTNTELKSWVESLPRGKHIQGYSNHLWNGVTPLQLGRVISGMIQNNLWFSGIQHLVPSDSISKFELISWIAKLVDREDLVIEPFRTNQSVNRTLSTINTERNLSLWAHAGYDLPPGIKRMIEQYNEWICTIRR
jgi:dTDP-4-dehydrorhamnose reductase